MYTNGDLRSMCDESQKAIIKMMLGNDDQKKIILAVLKERLGQGWPYNYKALDLLELATPADLMGMKDDLNKLAEAAATVQGHEELKKLAKPLAGKVKEAEKKQEEEEAKKKQEAIAAMWGGLWANDPYRGPSLAAAGWTGWPYPYVQMAPGVSAQAQVEWASKAPAGWNPWVAVPVAVTYPVYGWPKTG